MPASLHEAEVTRTLQAALSPRQVQLTPFGSSEPQTVTRPFPSPADWRDCWIYFLMVDRFNNPAAAPAAPWDRVADNRQGGTFEGIRRQLGYIRELGAGAIWLTPVLKNRQHPPEGSHHGYGIVDFLEVDGRFGTRPDRAEAELIQLVDEAHAHGLHVILDVVINHAGDVFAYDVDGHVTDSAPWSDTPYPICWRDERGRARREWPTLPPTAPRDAGVWPAELQSNSWFRRQGRGGPLEGDFATLKELCTDALDSYGDRPVWSLLIQAYRYAIARFDVDGFRIDTLKHVEREFALTFCNAIREYALSIGKKNFFIFGETRSDDEALLAAHTGRYTSDEAGRFGADAALDFPLQWRLARVAKGFLPPTTVQDLFALRRAVHEERHLLSTHGEASRFFVTFLDNHDDYHRFLFPRDGGDYGHQLTLALGCLFGLQGIPCLYYGTEQGLQGTQEIYAPDFRPEYGRPEHVREALWGKPNAFDRDHPCYREIQALARLRAAEPALRYGRQYFRPVSGNNTDFGFSRATGGILAFSRILGDREVLVLANTGTSCVFDGWVVVDARINSDSTELRIAHSNRGTTGTGTPESGPVTFHPLDGQAAPGWARRLQVRLEPMELQIVVPV
jgi:glycosidase